MFELNFLVKKFFKSIQRCLVPLACVVYPVANAQTESSSFNASYFQQLPVSSSVISKFIWPGSADFRNTYAASIEATPVKIIRGEVIRLRDIDKSTEFSYETWEGLKASISRLKQEKALDVAECAATSFVFYKQGGRWNAFPVDNEECYVRLSNFESPPKNLEISVLKDKSETQRTYFYPLTSWSSTNIDPALWDSWTYTSTLMKLDKPLYNLPQDPFDLSSDQARNKYYKNQSLVSDRLKKILESGDRNTLEKIRSAIEKPVLPSDYVLQSAAVFAEEAGELDLALDVRSRFKPVGRCSMDTWPQQAARDYAQLCYNNGDLACFLNLQVKIMAQNFERVAYSSYGEKVHDTEAEQLRSIGIDVKKFLKGLIHQFEVPADHDREFITTWRLARSIVEADLDEEFIPYLKELALDASIDEYNRLRATQVWVFALFYKQQNPDGNNYEEVRNSVVAEIEEETLSEVSKSWFDNQFKRAG